MLSGLLVRASFVCLIAVAVSGCATRHLSLTQRFVKPGEPSADYGGPELAGVRSDVPELQEYGRKLRELQAKATPKSSNLLPTIESRDPVLAEALMRVALMPTAENHRLVAAAYRNAGVSDHAFRHYQRALRLEPCDSAAYEGLARLWRDWSMPHLGLGDAHRALHCRPHSASAYNTLGTLLEALGQRKNARAAFEFALRLDDVAAYALNNLCYLSLQEGNGVEAQRACERALAITPTMVAARNNLALARALQGDIKGAEVRLLDSPDPATGHYNVGILRMSLGRYADAAQAFELAAETRPSLWAAARRARQARNLARAGKDEH